MLTITHKYLSSHETRKHHHIVARVAAFWQRVFQTLPNLDVHPGVAVYHTLKIFSIVNAKDLLMPHTKFQVCTLKINTIFCHRKKKSHYFWTGVYMTLILRLDSSCWPAWLFWTETFERRCIITSWRHDDVKWKYFQRYWPFVRGIHRSPVNSPHKGQWRGAFDWTSLFRYFWQSMQSK